MNSFVSPLFSLGHGDCRKVEWVLCTLFCLLISFMVGVWEKKNPCWKLPTRYQGPLWKAVFCSRGQCRPPGGVRAHRSLSLNAILVTLVQKSASDAKVSTLSPSVTAWKRAEAAIFNQHSKSSPGWCPCPSGIFYSKPLPRQYYWFVSLFSPRLQERVQCDTNCSSFYEENSGAEK